MAGVFRVRRGFLAGGPLALRGSGSELGGAGDAVGTAEVLRGVDKEEGPPWASPSVGPVVTDGVKGTFFFRGALFLGAVLGAEEGADGGRMALPVLGSTSVGAPSKGGPGGIGVIATGTTGAGTGVGLDRLFLVCFGVSTGVSFRIGAGVVKAFAVESFLGNGVSNFIHCSVEPAMKLDLREKEMLLLDDP